MTSPATTLSGQDLNVAANGTRALLDNLLAGNGLDFTEFVTLRTLSQAPTPYAGRAELRGELVRRLDTTTSTVDLMLIRLEARGLLTRTDERIDLSADGAAVFARLSGEVARVSAGLYRGIDPGDLAATQRVLAEVAHRTGR